MILSIDVGLKNLALCCVRPGEAASGAEDTIVRWDVVTTVATCQGLIDTFEAMGMSTWLPEVTEVVIERQPGKNTPMVRVQCYVEMYFASRDKRVSLADSKNKLAFAACCPYWPGGVPENWSYHTRKKLAVATVDSFLKNVPQPEGIEATFRQSRKKDDLADSCLQAMAHAHFGCCAHPGAGRQAIGRVRPG
jgi:hypothetical protein